MNAAEYKRLATERRAKEEIISLTLPSGAEWKVRRPPVQQFIIAGKLPASFASKMTSQKEGDGGGGAVDELSTEDIFKSLEFVRDMILYCAVEPRISLNPSSDDEIAPEDIIPEDFEFLSQWTMSGGAVGLDSFRQGRQQPAVDKPDGKKLRRTSLKAA